MLIPFQFLIQRRVNSHPKLPESNLSQPSLTNLKTQIY